MVAADINNLNKYLRNCKTAFTYHNEMVKCLKFYKIQSTHSAIHTQLENISHHFKFMKFNKKKYATQTCAHLTESRDHKNVEK